VSSRAEPRQGFNDREYTERAGKCKKFRVGSVVVSFYHGLGWRNETAQQSRAIWPRPFLTLQTRLIIGGLDATGNPARLQPKTVRKLFQSENLRKRIELEMDFCRIGEGAEVLTNEAVLPNLASCSLSGIPEKVAQKLNKKRPVVYCRS